MQEKFSAVIFANLRPANAISITFPLLRDTSMLGVQFAAGASGSRDKQSIGYTRVYIFHLCLSVHACRACGNKLIKLLVRVMRSTVDGNLRISIYTGMGGGNRSRIQGSRASLIGERH